ncbi:hypothetical protein [Parathalassolituus penaei]|uniref:ATP-binding protein n=1 Tax=Parathalassolituus penaei TaxID=2997323 RepID=A0A9X3ECR1_9GAMM|nr:hypothetical protein [Parathalassolituus penaei]MCY0965177.1 hypothetical protein [Parathalassolituus penaei]
MSDKYLSAIEFQESSAHWAELQTLPSRLSKGQVVLSESGSSTEFRFIKIRSVNKESAESQRLAMANVLSGLSHSGARLVYLLSGTKQGLELYFGVASETRDSHEHIKSLGHLLEGNFQGISLDYLKTDNPCFQSVFVDGAHTGLVTGVPSFNENSQHSENDFQGIERLANSLHGEVWQLMVVAEPGSEDEIRDAIDGLHELSTLASMEVKQTLQQGVNESTSNNESRGSSTGTSTSRTEGKSVSESEGTSSSNTEGKGKSASKSDGSTNTQNRTEKKSVGSSSTLTTGDSSNESITKGTNKGISHSLNSSETKGSTDSRSHNITSGTSHGTQATLGRERINKQIEYLIKQLDESVIQRFQLGLQKGMFRTAVYLSSPRRDTYERLTQGVRSIFQGNQPGLTPLQLMDLEQGRFDLKRLLRLHMYQGRFARGQLMAHGVPIDSYGAAVAGSWLNTRDLSLLVGVPGRELPGVALRESVDFGLNIPVNGSDHSGIKLARILHQGREMEENLIHLSKKDLSKHVFITGVTGAGKTTTCMRLLMESELPFLVIEPAKTEYRALLSSGVDLDIYQAGSEEFCPLRLNPFELVNSRVKLAGHIATLTSTLTAAYPMEAAMPQLVEEAIIAAYEAYGWDMRTGENEIFDNPWDPSVQGQCWPIFSDMIAQLDQLIESKGMGKEFEEKYRGSLVARLTNLTLGTKGPMLNTRRSLDFNALLDRKVVIELEELKSESDKALLMGLIINRLAECMKERHRQGPGFQHLTLIEEAHHLLSKPDAATSESRRQGVEAFANLLAEVRKYGEGLIIADQSPTKLIPDVIKNTHTKIVHRLSAADDRRAVGDAIGLDDEQRDFLPKLQTGETIVYCGGWNAPVWAKVTQGQRTDDEDIADEQLQELGQALQWRNRHRLTPKLAESDLVSDAATYARLIRSAPRALNALLNWVRAREQSGADQRRLKRKLALYQKEVASWQQQLTLDEEQLHSLVYTLLLDLANLPGDLEDWMAESCKSRVFEILARLLKLSSDEPLELVGRTRDVFDQLKNIPSL